MKSGFLRTGLRTFVLGLLVAGAPLAQAATINLAPPAGVTSTDPDLTLFNGALTYTYVKVCLAKSGTNTGICGTKTGSSNTTNYSGAQQWSKSYGKMTITGNNLTLKATPNSAPANVTNDNYSLSVIFGFNATGTAVSGILASDPWTGDALFSSNLSATGNTTVPGYLGPTLVTGKPINATLPPFNKAYNFGYAGTAKAGIFEFVFNNIGGNFGAKGQAGGIIASTFNLSHPLLGSGTWDSKGVNFWKNNFTATVNVDTFVPVPAALWLFGSALAGLGLARRRKAASATEFA